MNRKRISLLLVIAAIVAIAGGYAYSRTKSKVNMTSQLTSEAPVMEKGDALVDIKTSVGDIRVRLFGDTPAHRDNFLKLVKEKYYDGVLFHRVINEFMVQTGIPSRRTRRPTPVSEREALTTPLRRKSYIPSISTTVAHLPPRARETR